MLVRYPAEPMGFAVELHFDETSTLEIAALWSELQAVYCKPQRTELGVRPHLSLAVTSEEPATLAERIRPLAIAVAAFEVDLGGVDHFPGEEGVVFVEALDSPALREVHRQVSALLRATGAVNSALYEPPRWRPHCTIATDVPKGLMETVIKAATAARRPRVVRAEALCGVRYRPATVTFNAPLGAAE